MKFPEDYTIPLLEIFKQNRELYTIHVEEVKTFYNICPIIALF